MRLAMTIPGDIRAAETARRAVAAFHTHVPESRLELMAIVVNELVTNSLLHACMNGEPIDVSLEVRDATIRGEVRDPGAGFVAPTFDQPVDSAGGRGLMIVDSLTQEWGISASPDTMVWFEMSLAEAE